jgi:hypothetical protein
VKRSKPSLGSVKIEKFKGRDIDKGPKYRRWKKDVQAQKDLYDMTDQEFALLIWLSVEDAAKDTLDIMTLDEMKAPGGLQIVWKLLDDANGEDDEERFESAEQAWNEYKRPVGCSMDRYIQTMKRLLAEYLKTDPGTIVSQKALAQRLLNRAALTRTQRLTVFFNAGAVYDPKTIERVLRKMHKNIEQEDKKKFNEGRVRMKFNHNIVKDIQRTP